MSKNNIKKIIFLMLVATLLISSSSNALKLKKEVRETNIMEDNSLKKIDEYISETVDYDPLTDIKVKVTIEKIRALDKIDLFTDPDFYVKIIFEDYDQVFESPVFEKNQRYLKPNWSVECNVPDDKEWVNITIQLWDSNLFIDSLCDIAKNDNDNPRRRDISLLYNIKTGHWMGDDHITTPYDWSPDYSGYGRACGTDDNSIYERDKDCELWFDITQTDYDGDNIPYWAEVNVFETDPHIDNTGEDFDYDGVAIEWEFKWGYRLVYNHTENNSDVKIEHEWVYNPLEYENHSSLDPDGDALNNVEEYLTSAWGSDPFRKDIFVELDQMNGSSDGTIPPSILPNGSKELMRDAFDRQNIVFHLDDGQMGGSEMIPFDNTGDNTTREECREIYKKYFLHGNNDTWRKGIFHYGVMVYNATWPGYNFQIGAFQVSSKFMEEFSKNFISGNRDVVYASCYMHELGHSLGLTWLGGHTRNGGNPLHPVWLPFRPYESIMNYGYMYGNFWCNLVDYSDGSNGKNDFDDWSNINFYYFQQ